MFLFSMVVNVDMLCNVIQMMFNGIGWYGEDMFNYMLLFIDQYDDVQIVDIVVYVCEIYIDCFVWFGVDVMVVKFRKEDIV